MYKVRFEDDSEFMGGEPEDSRWVEMPDKGISSIQYKIMDVGVIFRGFEAYNHIVERATVVNPKPGMESNQILKVIVMGKWQDRVYETIYDFKKKTVYQSIEGVGFEYVIKEGEFLRESGIIHKQATSVSGWRIGKFDPHVMPKMKQY